MKAITLIAIAQSVAMELGVVSVAIDRARDDGPLWVADVEASYGGQMHVVRAAGASAEAAQTRALAVAVKSALPKAVLAELFALRGDEP